MSEEGWIEHYYPVEEIAERLNVSVNTIRRLVENEPGVLTITEKGVKRDRVWVYIPEGVWNRVYGRLTVKEEHGHPKK